MLKLKRQTYSNRSRSIKSSEQNNALSPVSSCKSSKSNIFEGEQSINVKQQKLKSIDGFNSQKSSQSNYQEEQTHMKAVRFKNSHNNQVHQPSIESNFSQSSNDLNQHTIEQQPKHIILKHNNQSNSETLTTLTSIISKAKLVNQLFIESRRPKYLFELKSKHQKFMEEQRRLKSLEQQNRMKKQGLKAPSQDRVFRKSILFIYNQNQLLHANTLRIIHNNNENTGDNENITELKHNESQSNRPSLVQNIDQMNTKKVHQENITSKNELMTSRQQDLEFSNKYDKKKQLYNYEQNDINIKQSQYQHLYNHFGGQLNIQSQEINLAQIQEKINKNISTSKRLKSARIGLNKKLNYQNTVHGDENKLKSHENIHKSDNQQLTQQQSQNRINNSARRVVRKNKTTSVISNITKINDQISYAFEGDENQLTERQNKLLSPIQINNDLSSGKTQVFSKYLLKRLLESKQIPKSEMVNDGNYNNQLQNYHQQRQTLNNSQAYNKTITFAKSKGKHSQLSPEPCGIVNQHSQRIMMSSNKKSKRSKHRYSKDDTLLQTKWSKNYPVETMDVLKKYKQQRIAQLSIQN
eukprot:403335773